MTTKNDTSPIDIRSTKANQPEHIAGQPVELMGIDMAVKLTGGDSVISIKNIVFRNARMDDYGVNYDMEFPNSNFKIWRKGLLSRARFGIDNFQVAMEVSQYTNACNPSSNLEISEIGKQRSEFTKITASARVWCWKKDEDLAVKALKKALVRATSKFGLVISDLGPKLLTAELALQSVPETAEKASAVRKIKP